MGGVSVDAEQWRYHYAQQVDVSISASSIEVICNKKIQNEKYANGTTFKGF